MSTNNALFSSLKFDLKRHFRGPSLWFFALACPVAANYIVPDNDAPYAVLLVNNAKPILTGAVLGLEIGVIAATLMIPLAYIFLRSGPTRHSPWQIMDVAPHSRILSTLGRWASDTLILWVLLAVLTLCAFIIGLFKIDGSMHSLQMVVSIWLPAAPALALTAAMRMLMESRNLTRKWLGDVIFLAAWLALLIAGIIGATDPETQLMISRPFSDAFGFTAPIIGSVDFPVDSVVIGGSTNPNVNISIDAWRGVTKIDYMTARLLWIAIAASLCVSAGLVWAPQKEGRVKTTRNTREANLASRLNIVDIPFVAPQSILPKASNNIGVIANEIRYIFRSKVWAIALLIVSVMGALTPFRMLAGPAILLIMIFLMTDASARWQSKTLGQLLDTVGPGPIHRAITLFTALSIISTLALIPASFHVIIGQEWHWLPHIGVMAVIVPAIVVILGAVSRSAVTGRLIMLISWYIYLSSAGFSAA